MYSEKDIRKVVKSTIERDENLGEHVGGSGHLGYKSYKIDHISKPEKIQTFNEELIKVTYEYTIYVETEFTYYPDNPPHEYKSRKTIFLDKRGSIIKKPLNEALWDDSS
ncbi:MAG: hypothetical protein ACFFFH_17780 [Candidatus Thorarchaeota archaeon]